MQLMNDTDKTTFELTFPKKAITFEGSSAYAKGVSLASMGHLTWVLENIIQHRSNPICLDIGANIGLTSLLMDQFIAGGHIFSFEPHPKTYGQLERNITSNQLGLNEIKTFSLGLGKEKGELLFRDVDQFNTGNSILLEGSLASKAQNVTTVNIERLDDMTLTAPDQRVDLMKIDVEGFELNVLDGAPDILKRTDVVLLEFNHWCLTSLARVFPEDALEYLFDAFEAVYVYDLSTKSYRRITTDVEKWSFLHKNMVNFNVNDLLCTSSQAIIDQLAAK